LLTSCVSSFVTVPATTEIHALSLHDALPIFQERKASPVHESSFALTREHDESGLKLDVVLQWTESTDEHVRSYVNGIPTGSGGTDRKSTRLNSSHVKISYAVFCLKKKKERLGGAGRLARNDDRGVLDSVLTGDVGLDLRPHDALHAVGAPLDTTAAADRDGRVLPR